jgi:partner of Y14 and mago
MCDPMPCSVRKELKIRPGFTPQEDLTRFRGSRQQDAEKAALPKGHIIGWIPPSSATKVKRGGKAGSSSGGGRSLEALASGEVSFIGTSAKTEPAAVSKSAKKNAKRTEKKKEQKQKELEEKIRAAWDDDSDDDIPRPPKKGKASETAESQQQPSSSGDQDKDDSVEDDTGLVDQVERLDI